MAETLESLRRDLDKNIENVKEVEQTIIDNTRMIMKHLMDGVITNIKSAIEAQHNFTKKEIFGLQAQINELKKPSPLSSGGRRRSTRRNRRSTRRRRNRSRKH